MGWDGLLRLLHLREPESSESKLEAEKTRQLDEARERVKFLDLRADSITRRPKGETRHAPR
jgi:hypothetical protein